MRVLVDAGAGFVNLSDLEGFDWVVSSSWGENVDSPMPDAVVMLRRRMHDLSLSLLMDGSKLNQGGALLNPGNAIRIETATIGMDQQPTDADFLAQNPFIGEIDRVDWKADPIELKCRGEAAPISDTFIETDQKFASAGDFVQEVAQDVIDANVVPPPKLFLDTGTAGVPRPTGGTDDPSFLLDPYKQQKQPVMAALRVLAGMIGWDVRYKFIPGTGKRELVFHEPGRDSEAIGTMTMTGQPVVTDTFDIDGVTHTAVAGAPAVNEFNIGADIEETARNISAAVNSGGASANAAASRQPLDVVRFQARAGGAAGNTIVFTESMANTTVDGAGFLGGTRPGKDASTTPDFTFTPDLYWSISQLALDRSRVRNVIQVIYGTKKVDRDKVTVSDGPSIAQFGRRFAGITEDSTSQIDTLTEALRMAQSILEDLKDPEATHGVSAPFFWPIEVSDVHKYAANGVHYDTDQTLAVVSFRHSVSGKKARTVITTRGKPSGGINRWLMMEGRQGVAPGTDLFVDDALPAPTFDPFMGGFRVSYDDPRTRNPPMNDWEYSELHISTAPTFTPTPLTFVSSGRTTRFEVSDLIPGQLYYVKVFAVDTSGNKTLVSSEVSVATQRVGPYHENIDGQQDQLLRNNDLNIFTFDPDTNMPDGWAVSVGTYESGGGADTIYRELSDSRTGDKALDLFYAGTAQSPAVISEFYPIQGDDIIQRAIVCKSVGANTDPEVRLIVTYYDSSKVLISTSTTTFDITTAYQRLMSPSSSAPATARYFTLTFAPRSTGDAATSFRLRVDKASLLRANGRGVSISIAGGFVTTVFKVIDGAATEVLGITEAVGIWTTEAPGTWHLRGSFQVLDTLPAIKVFLAELELRVNGAVVASSEQLSTVDTAGDQSAFIEVSTTMHLDAGDTVELYVKHNQAGQLNDLFGGTVLTQLVREES
jgi:hypothetical protein